MVALCLAFVAFTASAEPLSFGFDAPAALPSTGIEVTLIAQSTVPILPDPDGSIPLRDVQGRPLGPTLSDGQFCELAAFGSGVIGLATYQVVGTSRTMQANCRRYFSRLARKMPVAAGALGRSVFQRIETAHGLGAARYRLVPWRSVVADGHAIGTVLFVPALRGRLIQGRTLHDGYLFVADRQGDAPHAQLAVVVDAAWPDAALPSALVRTFVANLPGVAHALRRAHAIE